MLDVAVHPPQHISLQRREHGFTVALECKRGGFVRRIDRGFTKAPAERASNQPLQLRGARGPNHEEVSQPCVHLVGADSHALQ